MPKFVFTTIAGARYSAEATSEIEAKKAILKSHPWVRRWDLVLESPVDRHAELQLRSRYENHPNFNPYWFT